MSEMLSPRHIVAMALHRENCGERSPEATHPADWDCHLIDADAALKALGDAGYSLLALKVQDLARETARLGRLIDAVIADGHRTHEDCRTLHCGICRALREVTGAEATR